MTKKALIVVILLLGVSIFAGYKLFFREAQSLGGLKVTANPASNIFFNDKLIGKTPYEDKQSPGEYVLKLIPLDSITTASSWQGKIKINPGVLTYINRDLGASELTSAGEILTLEKNPQNEVQLAVSSQPDAAMVLLDGQEKGTTPLVISNIASGEHDATLSSPGFISRTVRVQTTVGYKLDIAFQLALSGDSDKLSTESGVSVTPSQPVEKEDGKTYVRIKDTPTGFLRVRSSPSTSATEAAQVKPGEKFPLIEEKEGWYKISYETDKEGWVSGRYVEKI